MMVVDALMQYKATRATNEILKDIREKLKDIIGGLKCGSLNVTFSHLEERIIHLVLFATTNWSAYLSCPVNQ